MSNDFLPFAGGGSANVVSQAAYAALTTLLANGFQTGVAQSNQLNKVWRQSSIISAAVAQFIANQSGQNVVDDGTTTTITANMLLAVQNTVQNILTSSATVATTGGSTTLSGAQLLNSFIIVTGALISNATIVFPNGPRSWFVINQTTGGFSLTCKTASGTGVPVRQGVIDEIVADGTNVQYSSADAVTQAPGNSSTLVATTAFVQQEIGSANQYPLDTGAANAYVVTPSPAVSSYANGYSLRFRAVNANNAASTLKVGSGPIWPLRRSDGNPVQPGDITATQLLLVTADTASSTFLINGVLPSQSVNSSDLYFIGQM